MGIFRNGHEYTGRHRGGHDFQETWKFIDGAWRMIWQAIRSCFGKGFWNNIRSWSNTDGWRNF